MKLIFEGKNVIKRFNGIPDLKTLVSSPYGPRVLNGLESKPTFHKGVDLRLGNNCPIAFDSVVDVTYSGYNKECGNYNVIWYVDSKNNAKRIFICHLTTKASVGKYAPYNVIATTGNTGMYTTGAHLHLGLCYKPPISFSRYETDADQAYLCGYLNPLDHIGIAPGVLEGDVIDPALTLIS